MKHEPDIPAAAEHVWQWFFDLDGHRTCGMGINPLTWSDIRAWSELNSIVMQPWELRAILAMDRVRVEWLNKPEKERNTAPATADAVKAAFRSAMNGDPNRQSRAAKPSKRTK